MNKKLNKKEGKVSKSKGTDNDDDFEEEGKEEEPSSNSNFYIIQDEPGRIILSRF